MHESIYYRLGYALAYQAGTEPQAQQSLADLIASTQQDLVSEMGDDVTYRDVADVAGFTLREDYLRNDYVHQAFLALFTEQDWSDARQKAFVRGVDDAATIHIKTAMRGER